MDMHMVTLGKVHRRRIQTGTRLQKV